MTYEEYRQHMRAYSRDTMVMSFVVTKHPDFQALKDAGDEVIPWLLHDLLDPDWYCAHCYGEGFEFPAGWEWDSEKRNWPTDTGIPCTKCKGKGGINSTRLSWCVRSHVSASVRRGLKRLYPTSVNGSWIKFAKGKHARRIS